MKFYKIKQNLHCKIYRIEWLVKWSVFLGLCCFSGYSIYTVLTLYLAEQTSFKVYEEPIIEAPAITICFSSPEDGKYSSDKKIFGYGIDFNITVKVINELANKREEKILRKGKNILENNASQSLFQLEELYTKYDGTCYTIAIEFEGNLLELISTNWIFITYAYESK